MGRVAVANLTKTKTPGTFRRHAKGCDGEGRCGCSYVVIWRHRGKQHMETFRAMAEAREAQGQHKAGARRPTSKVLFGDYFAKWIEGYEGLTTRGFSETSRALYRRAIVDHALPEWRTWKLAEVEPTDVRDLFKRLRHKGKSRATLKTLRAALSAMYATAREQDGLVDANPAQGVRLPPAGETGEGQDRQRAKALTREELRLFLAALPEDGYWRRFFEFLTVTGLRIGEAVALTWENLELGDVAHVKVREQVYRGERKRLKSSHSRREVPLSESMAARCSPIAATPTAGRGRPSSRTAPGRRSIPSNVRRTILRPAALALGAWVSNPA